MQEGAKPSPQKRKGEKPVGVPKLVIITYCLVCAGSYGIEEVVQAAGPVLVIIFMFVISLLMGFPVSMIYSELGSIFPQTGSTILWSYGIYQRIQQEFDRERVAYNARELRKQKLKLGFSMFVARFSANLLLLKALIDNSVYPTMICDYLQQVIPGLSHIYYRLLVSIASFAIIFVFNMYGVDAVGVSQYVIATLLLTPVVLFVVLAFPDYDARYLQWSTRPETIDYVTVLSNLVWQFSGYDQLTNLSDSIANPQRTFPITYISVIFLVILTYLMTVISGIMIEQDFDRWDNGALATISLKLRGCANGWLQWCLTIGGAVSAFAILNSSVTCTALELYCNAHVGLLPFSKLVDRMRSFRRKKHRQPAEAQDTAAPAAGLDDKYLYGDLQDRDHNSFNGEVAEEQGLVPWVAVITVSVIPVFLIVLPFNTLVKLDAFLIAFSMFVQIILYIYHRHGRYGYYSYNKPDSTVFHLGGGVWTTVVVVFCPLTVGFVLIVIQGPVMAAIFVALQLLIFGIYEIQILIDKNPRCCRRKARYRQLRKNMQGARLFSEV